MNCWHTAALTLIYGQCSQEAENALYDQTCRLFAQNDKLATNLTLCLSVGVHHSTVTLYTGNRKRIGPYKEKSCDT